MPAYKCAPAYSKQIKTFLKTQWVEYYTFVNITWYKTIRWRPEQKYWFWIQSAVIDLLELILKKKTQFQLWNR